MLFGQFILPGGYTDRDGCLHVEGTLKPLTGKEEEILADTDCQTRAVAVTRILSSAVETLGTIHPVSEEVIRDLPVADRQYLLLKLRQITFGDKIEATIQCPWPDCGRPVDIHFNISDIPIKGSTDKGPVYSLTLSAETKALQDDRWAITEIRFRLPTGRDQELLSPIVFQNEAIALTMLLERCVLEIDGTRPSEDGGIERLVPMARQEIESAMAAAVPDVALDMETDCAECGRFITAPFDIQDFFFGEFRTSRDLLYREVHYLAYHYHWSEQEILKMERNKRRHYIEILADEIEKLNNGM